MQREVPCDTPLVCERRCNGMRACQRHACKRRCCDGCCPPCEEVCGRWLRCGNHKCPAPCHSGPCRSVLTGFFGTRGCTCSPVSAVKVTGRLIHCHLRTCLACLCRPCPLTLEVACACGSAHSTLPCGAEKWAVPPRCTLPCRIPQLCRHAPASAGSLPHTCHYGPCPPCELPCGTSLPCGHVCGASRCHDPAPPAPAAFQRPAPPVALASLSQQLGSGHSQGAGPGLGAGRAKAGGGGASAAPGQQQPPAVVALQQATALQAAGSVHSGCPPCRVQVDMQCLGR